MCVNVGARVCAGIPCFPDRPAWQAASASFGGHAPLAFLTAAWDLTGRERAERSIDAGTQGWKERAEEGRRAQSRPRAQQLLEAGSAKRSTSHSCTIEQYYNSTRTNTRSSNRSSSSSNSVAAEVVIVVVIHVVIVSSIRDADSNLVFFSTTNGT